MTLNVFPNPASTFLNIDGLKGHSNFHYQLFNAQGQLLTSGKLGNFTRNRINIQTLPDGLFWLVVESEERKGRTRFIKQNSN